MLESLRNAARALVRQPRLSILAILILGLGIGLATGVYSVASGLILRGLPFPEADRLVAVGEFDPQAPEDRLPVRLSSLRAWSARQTTLEGLASYRAAFTYLRWPGGGTDAFVGATVAPELFPLLRVRAQLGRLPGPGDCAAGEPVVVVSDSIWRSRFGRSRAILGASVGINRQPHSVIGVMPPGFGFPYRQDLWTPLCPRDLAGADEGRVALYAVGRLRSGVSLREAQGEFRVLSERTSFVAASVAEGPPSGGAPPSEQRLLARIEPYLLSVTDANLRRALAAVGGAAGLLLFVCCGTVALLLLLGTLRQQRALAVRAALGASLGRIQRETWLEALLLGLAGGLLGLAMAQGCIVLFNLLLVPSQYLRGFWVGVRLDPPTLAVALGAAVLAVPLAGLLPALRSARTDPMEVLRRGSGGSLGRVGRPGRLLVGGQVALSCVLLVGAAITASAGLRSLRVPYGFDPAGLAIAKVSLYGKEGLASAPPEAAARIYARTLGRVRALPEVRGAALTSALPTQVYSRRDFLLPGEEPAGVRRSARVLAVTPGYAPALGLPLLAGRDFTEADTPQAPPVLLVNRAFTRRYFAGDPGLGRELGLIRQGEPSPTWYRVVGVVGDSAMGGEEEIRESTDPEAFYLPLAQSKGLDSFTASLLVRSSVPPARLVEAIRREARAVEPDLAVWEAETLVELLRRESWVARAFTGLFALFGLAAATMACAGLYGIVALDVRRRRRDFGIHQALGAQPRDLVKLVVRRGAPELIAGLVAGLAVALILARRFAGVFDSGLSEPAWIGGAVGLLALAGALALLLPARQVGRTDPMASMRPEVEEG